MTPTAIPQTKEDMLETRSIELDVISPVHIGTREGTLRALEFAVHEGRTYVVNEERFGVFLRDKGLLDRFVEAARSGPLNLKEFITKNIKVPLPVALKEISSHFIVGGAEQMREFRPFVRDGMGKPYVPGTAIKGVLRTAVLYNMLLHDASQKAEVVKSATSNLSKLQGYRKEQTKKSYSAKWLQEKLLERYSLANAREGSNRDILRCLKVRDAYPIGDCETRVIRIEFLSKRSGGEFYWSSKKRGGRDTGQPLDLWLEALVQATFKTDLVWDRVLFNHFKRENPNVNWPLSGIDDLLSMLFRMSQEVTAHEKGFFPGTGTKVGRATQGSDQKAELAAKGLSLWYKECPRELTRIGFGSGMLSTTVNLHFPMELRQKIRDACGHPRPADPAPKSRRIWSGTSGQWYPMGWVAVALSGEGARPRGLGFPEAEVVSKIIEKSPKPGGHAERDLPSVPQSPKHQRGKIPSPPPTQVRKPQVRDFDALEISALRKQIDVIQPNDRLAIERIVKAIEDLESEEEQRQIASLLKHKLERAGLWSKHPKKFDIEVFLAIEGESE